MLPGVGEWYVNGQNTLDRTDWIRGWVASQLFSRGLAECVDNPLQQRRGGWWADAFRTQKFSSGSLLWTLKWARVNNETLIKARDYAYEAIGALIGWGVCSKIKIVASYINPKVLHLDITLFGPGDSTMSLRVSGSAMPDFTVLWQVVPVGSY
jgi:phage gp46-like protein